MANRLFVGGCIVAMVLVSWWIVHKYGDED
jgi:hypothetical protein